MKETIAKIIALNNKLRNFWSNAQDWAPIDAAKLLSKSRLDRQVSLSHTLNIFLNTFDSNSSAGALILGYANLGSLVEGTLKLKLSVYLNDYSKGPLKKKNKIKLPDVLQLEELRLFFERNIWVKDVNDHWDKWINDIQQKRNSIHAFRHRDIGSWDEFFGNIKKYLEFLEYIDSTLPYPDREDLNL